MNKYLVCRKEALRPGNQINSSCFPIVVEVSENDYDHDPERFFEMVVMRAFASINEDYIGKHDYVVIPMNHAFNVRFKPRATYDVSIERYV